MTDRNVDELLNAWMDLGPATAPDRVAEAARLEVRSTPQTAAMRWWPPRRLPHMNNTIRLALGAAAAVAVALFGYAYLVAPNVGGPGLDDPIPTPTLLPTIPPTPSPTPGWPEGTLEAGRHEVTHDTGVAFSFEVPEGWRSMNNVIESGTYPTDGFRWIMYLQEFNGVATDRCTTARTSVGPSVEDLADAMTTIPGTVAADPVDATVGGLPARMVELTLEPNVPCPFDEFWLFGAGSAYPGSPESTIRVWVFELDGTRYAIFTEQIGSDPAIGQEIVDIVESTEFD